MSSGYRISPRITAVIPAYNAEEFVSAAIKSVLMQSAPIFECIVVDDGSRDGTGSAIGSFADRVRLIRTKNQGVAHARNIGIEAAKGDYIGFLDADDVWLPKKLERQIRKLTLQPDLAMIYSGLHLIDQHSRFIGEMRPAPGDIALERTLLLEKPFMTGIGSTGLISRDVFREHGGFNPDLSTSADHELACRIACRYPVDAVHAPLVLYRQHLGQMHRDPRVVKHDMTIAFDTLFKDPALPDNIRTRRRRAEANLLVSLSGASLKRGELLASLRLSIGALLKDPTRVAAGVWRLMTPGGPKDLRTY